MLPAQQDSLKDEFYFCTDPPSDIQHDAILRASRCFFVSSTGMLCLFQDAVALQGDVILYLSCRNHAIQPDPRTEWRLSNIGRRKPFLVRRTDVLKNGASEARRVGVSDGGTTLSSVLEPTLNINAPQMLLSTG